MSKPFTALLVHELASRRELFLDAPVATYWPEFSRNGKENVTIRQVLSHRGGLPVARNFVEDVLAMTEWKREIRSIENSKLKYEPGSAPAYHIISYGFILGEIIRRVTGTPVRELLREMFFEPLRLRNIFLGLPEALRSRELPIHGGGPAGPFTKFFLNRNAVREAPIPSAGISTNARDLAVFYQALLDGGEFGGVRILDEKALDEAKTPTSDGEIDRFLHSQVRWSEGFQLGGPATNSLSYRPMGRTSSVKTFGHNGSSCCLVWSDPTRRLVFAYLTNRLPYRKEGLRHMSAVSDSVLSACA